MVMTKVDIPDRVSNGHVQLVDHSQVNINNNQSPIVTLNSNEVAWLFGIDVHTVEEWVVAGIITPCSSAPDGSKRFWRKDIAELLASYGA